MPKKPAMSHAEFRRANALLSRFFREMKRNDLATPTHQGNARLAIGILVTQRLPEARQKGDHAAVREIRKQIRVLQMDATDFSGRGSSRPGHKHRPSVRRLSH